MGTKEYLKRYVKKISEKRFLKKVIAESNDVLELLTKTYLSEWYEIEEVSTKETLPILKKYSKMIDSEKEKFANQIIVEKNIKDVFMKELGYYKYNKSNAAMLNDAIIKADNKIYYTKIKPKWEEHDIEIEFKSLNGKKYLDDIYLIYNYIKTKKSLFMSSIQQETIISWLFNNDKFYIICTGNTKQYTKKIEATEAYDGTIEEYLEKKCEEETFDIDNIYQTIKSKHKNTSIEQVIKKTLKWKKLSKYYFEIKEIYFLSNIFNCEFYGQFKNGMPKQEKIHVYMYLLNGHNDIPYSETEMLDKCYELTYMEYLKDNYIHYIWLQIEDTIYTIEYTAPLELLH